MSKPQPNDDEHGGVPRLSSDHPMFDPILTPAAMAMLIEARPEFTPMSMRRFDGAERDVAAATLRQQYPSKHDFMFMPRAFWPRWATAALAMVAVFSPHTRRLGGVSERLGSAAFIQRLRVSNRLIALFDLMLGLAAGLLFASGTGFGNLWPSIFVVLRFSLAVAGWFPVLPLDLDHAEVERTARTNSWSGCIASHLGDIALLVGAAAGLAHLGYPGLGMLTMIAGFVMLVGSITRLSAAHLGVAIRRSVVERYARLIPMGLAYAMFDFELVSGLPVLALAGVGAVSFALVESLAAAARVAVASQAPGIRSSSSRNESIRRLNAAWRRDPSIAPTPPNINLDEGICEHGQPGDLGRAARDQVGGTDARADISGTSPVRVRADDVPASALATTATKSSAVRRPSTLKLDSTNQEQRRSSSQQALVILIVLVLLAGGLVALRVGPGNELRCRLDATDGWEIDIPDEIMTLDRFRAMAEEQTDGCVRLQIDGPDGFEVLVVDPIGGRVSVASDRLLTVTTSA